MRATPQTNLQNIKPSVRQPDSKLTYCAILFISKRAHKANPSKQKADPWSPGAGVGWGLTVDGRWLGPRTRPKADCESRNALNLTGWHT